MFISPVSQTKCPFYSGIVLKHAFKLTCPVQEESGNVEQVVTFTRSSPVHGQVTGIVGYFLGKGSTDWLLPLDMDSLTITSMFESGIELTRTVSVEVTNSMYCFKLLQFVRTKTTES